MSSGLGALAGATAVTALLTWLLRSPRPSSRPRTATSSPCHPASSGGLPVDVVFCSIRDGVARLDCVVAGGPVQGWPFAFEVGVPMAGAWAAAAERLLRRWCDEEAPVLVRFLPSESGMRARLRQGATTMVLDVTDSSISLPPR